MINYNTRFIYCLNVGLNKTHREPHKKTRIEHTNKKIVIESNYDWYERNDADEIGKEFRNKITEAYPEWNITGYFMARQYKLIDKKEN